MIIFYSLVFILGAIIGSFLNVVIVRYNSGRNIGGRSSCGSCGAVLKWYELIPVASFVVQKGRCRACKSRISWQYPLVELGTGALFALALIKFGVPLFAYAAVLLSLLIVIFVYDLRHKIIPDGIVYAFDLLALVPVLWQHNWQALVVGPLLALPFALLWLVSKGNWIGLGDAKLILGIGWLMGLMGGFSAVVLGVWLGAIFSLVVMALGRLSMKSEIPLAPFLILGFLLVFFFNIDILALVRMLMGV